MKKTHNSRPCRYGTVEEFDKAYFPRFHKLQSKEQKVISPGDFGQALADEFLSKVKATLRK